MKNQKRPSNIALAHFRWTAWVAYITSCLHRLGHPLGACRPMFSSRDRVYIVLFHVDIIFFSSKAGLDQLLVRTIAL